MEEKALNDIKLPDNAFTELKPGEKYEPVMSPQKTYPEVNGWSVTWGVLMTILFSAAAAYLGLRVGQVFEAAIPIAIIAVGVSTAAKRHNALGENVIIQSIGACSGAVVAGAIFTLPAIYILQDKYQDWLQKHVNMLRFAAYNVLTRLQVPEREAISYAIAAYGVLYLAVTTFDMQFEAQRIQYGVDVRKEYAFASMHGIKRTWNDLLAYIVPEDVTRAVSDDHDFRLAMEILTKKASDFEGLNDIAGEVIVENKEKLLANANSDEVREYIEKEYIEKLQEQ